MKNHIFLIFILVISCSKNKPAHTNNIIMTEGDLKKEITSIVEKKWIEVYGKSVEKQKPYVIKKKNDTIWIVHGTFSKPTIGGVAYAEINIKTKEIISYTHGE